MDLDGLIAMPLTESPARPGVGLAPAPQRSLPLVLLSLIVAALALAAAAAASLTGGGGAPVEVVSIRGERVLLFGRGLYRFDTLFIGAGYRGQDLATLSLAVPALLAAVFLYGRGWLGSRLLLSGVLAFFVYANGSFALGAAYNPAYLLYVGAFSSSVFALVMSFRESAYEVGDGADEASAGPTPDESAVRPHALPRRGAGALLIASGLGTIAIWLPPVVSAWLEGATPPLLGTYTTLVTETLDLALIAPTAVFAGLSVLRGQAVGYRLAFPLFGIIVLLAPTIVAATASQVAAGVRFTPGQIVGPIAAFLTMGLLSVWAAASILRALRRRGR
jgi:hypothetical protein